MFKKYIKLYIVLFILIVAVPAFSLKVKATEVQEPTYNLTFTKTEPDNKTVIQGAGYTLYNDKACRIKALYASGAAMDEFFTGSDGKIIINNLLEGTYYLKETTTPYGFETDKTVYKIDVAPKKISIYDSKDDTALKGLTGEPIVKEVTFSNTNTMGSGIEGGSFAIYPDNNCLKAISEVKADEKGNVTFENIRYGTYWLRQLKAAPGYRASCKLYKVTVDEDIDINDGKISTTTITNDQTSDIVLFLASEADNTVFIEGALFGLYTDSACTTLIETATSDSNGQVIFNDVTRKGNLYIRQLKTPSETDNGGTLYRMYDKRIYTANIDDLGNVTFPNITYEGFIFEECNINKVVNVPVTIVTVGAICSFTDSEGEILSLKEIGEEAEEVTFSLTAMSGTDTPNDNNMTVTSQGATGRLARADINIDITFMPYDTTWRYKVEETAFPVGYEADDIRRETLIKIVKDEEGNVTVRYALDGSKFKLYKDDTQLIFNHTRREDYDYVIAKAEEEAMEEQAQADKPASQIQNQNQEPKLEAAPSSMVDSIYIIVPVILLVLLIIMSVIFAIKQFGGKNMSL